MAVTNRFKGLDLIDRVPEELWTEVRDIVEEAVIKTIPKKKKCKEIEKNNRMGKISSRKLEIPREHFMQRVIREYI